MKKLILTLLLSASYTLNTIPASQSETRSVKSMITSFFAFPEDVYLDTPIKSDSNGLIQLDENRIHELRDKIKHNFMRRSQLTLGSSALGLAGFMIGLHQFGALNLLNPIKDKVASLSGSAAQAAKNFVTREEMLAYVKQREDLLRGELDLVPKAAWKDWLWDSTKKVSSLFTLTIIYAKIMHMKNYIDAKPTMDYFSKKYMLGQFNLIDRVDVLRKTVAAAVQPADGDIYSSDYHRRAVTPMLQSLATNLEKLVAFTEYYFASHDQEIVRKEAMEDHARRLFNVSNTFFAKMHEQLQKPSFDPDIVAIVEEFKGELTMSVKRCVFFERTVQED